MTQNEGALNNFLKAMNEKFVSEKKPVPVISQKTLTSLKDKELAAGLKKMKSSKSNGKELKNQIADMAEKRYTSLSKQMQEATRLL